LEIAGEGVSSGQGVVLKLKGGGGAPTMFRAGWVLGFRRRHPKIKALIMGVDSFDTLLLNVAKFYAVIEHILNRKI
jgi:hypothetical protein